MTVQLIDISGEPLSGVGIYVNSDQHQTDGAWIIVGPQDPRGVTDANGKLEIQVIPNIEVEVGIEGFSLHRRFTVPATAFNLNAYISGTYDLFTIQTP